MKNSLVVKNNDLIEARYDLNLLEQKIILYSVSKIDTNKNSFNVITLEVKEISRMLGTNIDRYSEFSSIANGLMDRKVYLKDRPKLDVRWLASSEYIGNGLIELEFSEKLIPYLLQLKSKFTRYQLKNIINLKNKYSLRIYELLKQYETIGKRKFNLDELKNILFIEGQYNRIYDFKKHVLDKAKDEINIHTDIEVGYTQIKTGRKITDILFEIDSKNEYKKDYVNYLNKTYNIKEMQNKMGLKNENLNSEQIIHIYQKTVEMIDENEIAIFEYIRLNYLYVKNKKNARNIYSYLLKAIKKDYASAKGQISLDYYLTFDWNYINKTSNTIYKWMCYVNLKFKFIWRLYLRYLCGL